MKKRKSYYKVYNVINGKCSIFENLDILKMVLPLYHQEDRHFLRITKHWKNINK